MPMTTTNNNVAIAATAAILTTSTAVAAYYYRKWLSAKKKDQTRRCDFGESMIQLTNTQLFPLGANPQMLSVGPEDTTSKPCLPKMHATHYTHDGTTGNNSRTAVAVVIIHGFGCTMLEWTAVQTQLTELDVDIFGYDRILFVDLLSPAPPQKNVPAKLLHNSAKRDATTLARELHQLLANGKVQPPYILLGHSYGGLIAQHYAHLYPAQVVGMVLIDPAHERQFHEFPADFALPFIYLVPVIFSIYQRIAWTGILQVLDRWGLFNFPPLFLLPKQSPERIVAAKFYSDGSVWKRVKDELRGCIETFDQMNQNSQNNNSSIRQSFLESMPIGLVIAGHRVHSPTLFPQAVTRAFLDMHQEFWMGNRNGKLFLANQSDHWVHMQQPEIIVEAVQFVLERVREQQ